MTSRKRVALLLAHLIHLSTKRLENFSENPRWEAELLLSHVLGVDRSYLYTYPEQALTTTQQVAFEGLLERRCTGEPFAYIVGRKAFWSFELEVTPAVLIPRPETELLVELMLQHLPANVALCVAELGTGSGAIAIALALERPAWQIVATDRSESALKIAQSNAAQLNCSNIDFYLGDWCNALSPRTYAAIVSNPPYIALLDPEIAPSVAEFEPKNALFSGADGLEDLCKIIKQANAYLDRNGWLFLEHGASQAEAVVALLKQNQYTQISTYSDLSNKPRVTVGLKTRVL